MHKFYLVCLLSFLYMQPCSAEYLSGTGTGFLVNDSGWVITNNHVVAACSTIKVNNSQGFKLIVDEEDDLAAFRVSYGTITGAPIKIRKDVRPLGEDIIVLGYPLNMGFRVTPGLISNDDSTQFSEDYQTNAQIRPGNSGGPVIDLHGGVVGVAVSYLDKSNAAARNGLPSTDSVPDISMMVKNNILTGFLEAHNIPYQYNDNSIQESVKDLTDRLRDSVVLVECYKNQEAQESLSASAAESGNNSLPPKSNSINSVYWFGATGRLQFITDKKITAQKIVGFSWADTQFSIIYEGTDKIFGGTGQRALRQIDLFGLKIQDSQTANGIKYTKIIPDRMEISYFTPQSEFIKRDILNITYSECSLSAELLACNAKVSYQNSPSLPPYVIKINAGGIYPKNNENY